MTAPLKRYCMVVSTVSATGGQRRDVEGEECTNRHSGCGAGVGVRGGSEEWVGCVWGGGGGYVSSRCPALCE